MIPFFSFLTTAQAELSVQTNLQEHYIAGQPIFVDIRVQNIGSTPETLPNLDQQTWKVRWTMNNSNGKQTLRSTEGENQAQWILQPRQLKEVRFLIPNSAKLPTGKQTIELQIELPQESYLEKKEIYIHPKDPLWEDRDIRADLAFFPEGEYLWGQAFSTTQQVIFLEKQQNSALSVPILRADKELRFVQSISNHDHHIYALQRNRLLIHTLARDEVKKGINISIPWKQVSILARGITDSDQQLVLPLWIPDPNQASGTIRSIQISKTGDVSYRKIISLPTKPVSMDTALTSTGTPLYLIQTENRVYLFPLTQTGNAQIDQLPPQNITLRNISKEEQLHSHFGLDSDIGLIIHLLSQDKEQLSSIVYSLQGTEQTKNVLPTPEKPLQITSVCYYNTALILLGKDEQFWYQLAEKTWRKLPASQYPISQSVRVDLLQNHPDFPFIYHAKSIE